MDFKNYIRDIPDWPKPGVIFKDITPLLRDRGAFKAAIEALAERYRSQNIDLVVSVEARGFIFGALAAWQLGSGFVPLRKPGKLPAAVETVRYALEYGSAALEVHGDALGRHRRVLLVDDVLATGGTAAAGVDLVTRLGASVVGCAFVLELAALGGRARLAGQRLHSVLAL
jgi:adenine phosphoribosyltransferase